MSFIGTANGFLGLESARNPLFFAPAGSVWSVSAEHDRSLVSGSVSDYAAGYSPARNVDISSGVDLIQSPASPVANHVMDSVGVVVVEFERETPASGTTRYVFDVSNGTYNERALAAINTAGKLLVGGNGATSGFSSALSVATLAAGGRYKAAVLISATEVRFSLDGAAVVGVTRTNAIGSYTKISVGTDAVGNTQLNGGLVSMSVIDGTRTDAELQALSA